MYCDYICPGHGKNVLDTDVLDVELNSRELLEEIPEPAFNSTLSPERAACVNFTRVDKDAIIPPNWHGLGQVMLVHSLERGSYGFLGNKGSNQ